MSSFVFNSFKERYLKGNVPSKDAWSFIPVSEEFKNNFDRDDIRLDQYKTLQDFKDISDRIEKETGNIIFNYTGTGESLTTKGLGLLEGKKIRYKWAKVYSDANLTNKPMFITTGTIGEENEIIDSNYDEFEEKYKDIIIDNIDNIKDYLDAGGFYFIRSKDELEWFANRAEENNTIIGVLGDGIEGDIEKPICVNDNKPFEGILDGNGFPIDINIIAKNSDNGLVGILGKGGIVRNFKLKHKSSKNNINCELPITLNYIKNDGRDINCGLLVGRNYGTIENIDGSTSEQIYFELSGFVPSVYSVTNKTDEVKWNETENVVRKKFDEKNENFFYLNSFCINSPGNICPYVGYFNEGKFSDDEAGLYTDCENFNDIKNYLANDPELYISPDLDLNLQLNNYNTLIKEIKYNPLGYFYSSGDNLNIIQGLHPNYEIEDDDNTEKLLTYGYIKSPVYYGLDNFGHFTVRAVGSKINQSTISSPKELFNSNIIQKALGEDYRNNLNLIPSRENSRNSLRLHPQARAAYNVGVIVGANFGTIQNVSVNAIIMNTSNFVGFIGGIAGKQANGLLYNVSVSSDFQLDYGENDYKYDTKKNTSTTNFTVDSNSINNKGYKAFYKQTPILPNCCKQYLQSISSIRLSPDYETQIGSIENIIEKYCEPWYELKEDEHVSYTNTAQDITDDVIAYNLRPIFVAGGLFGRYIPTINSTTGFMDNRHFSDCILNQVNVKYKDNYYSSIQDRKAKYEGKDNEEVVNNRPENAFGIIAGKVDYSIITNNVYIKPSLSCVNCNFSAGTTVGKPSKYCLKTWDRNQNDNSWALLSASGDKKLFGIFELKNNILDSISYDVNEQKTYTDFDLDDDEEVEERDKLISDNTQYPLTSAGIFWASDYPFDLSSDDGGIIRTHNMFNYINFSVQENLDAVQLYSGENPTIVPGNVNDFNTHFYNEPNYNVNDYSGGLNKRNIAKSLINFNGCYSNANNLIEIYDDYFSQYNMMNLPDYNELTGTQITQENYLNNTFTDSDKYVIEKYWDLYKTNYTCNLTNMHEEDFISYLNWDNTEANITLNSALYNDGLWSNQIDTLLMKGTQNTFDGYTTVDYGKPFNFRYSQRAPSDNITPDRNYIKYYKENGVYKISGYNLARKIKKNIVKDIPSDWIMKDLENPIVTYTIDNDKNTTDNYFYYTYTATPMNENNVSSQEISLADAFGFTKRINFKYSPTSSIMGYCMDLTKEEIETKTSNDISIGDYYTPENIRRNIITPNYDRNKNLIPFITSGVSSTNKLGGLLVVDSNNNNVMYLDMENPIQLTGNPVKFNTESIFEDGIKVILKVD